MRQGHRDVANEFTTLPLDSIAPQGRSPSTRLADVVLEDLDRVLERRGIASRSVPVVCWCWRRNSDHLQKQLASIGVAGNAISDDERLARCARLGEAPRAAARGARRPPDGSRALRANEAGGADRMPGGGPNELRPALSKLDPARRGELTPRLPGSALLHQQLIASKIPRCQVKLQQALLELSRH